MRQDFELRDGRLTVYQELESDYNVSFDRACNELVASDPEDLVIDLSRVRQITSSCIGMMAAAYIKAGSQEKKLSIIAQGQVLKVLKMAGFANLMRLSDSGRFKVYVEPNGEKGENDGDGDKS